MTQKQFTIQEVLQRTRHDYANELQLLLIHLELQDVEQAKKTILTMTDTFKQQSRLTALQLPLFEEWLLTVHLRYTNIHFELLCRENKAATAINDKELTSIIQRLFDQFMTVADVSEAYTASIQITSSATQFTVVVSMYGALPTTKKWKIYGESLIVEETISHNFWTFTICEQ